MPGAAYVLDALGLDARMHEAGFVVTGEGKLDAQTLGVREATTLDELRQAGLELAAGR